MLRFKRKSIRCTGWVFAVLAGLGSAAAAANTFTVSQSFGNASQTGTLYWAITQSNATPGGPHTINFSVPNITIDPNVQVPPITRNVIIDGDRGANPDVDIAASLIAYGFPLFDVETPSLVWIRNLSAGGAFRNIVYVEAGSDNVILSDLATDTAGEACIHVKGKTTMLRVTARNCGKRNISNAQAGQRSGIWVQNVDNAQISGSFVGLAANGDGADESLANYFYGIVLDNADDAVIGGTGSNRNVISNNRVGGILVRGSNGALIQNNYIGLTVDGTGKLRNGFLTTTGYNRGGIVVENSSGLTIGADTTRGNTIAASGQAGIFLQNAQQVLVYGNNLGTNAAGTGGWPIDQGAGIYAVGGLGATRDIDVGDASNLSHANTIGFNLNYGVHLLGSVGEFRIRGNSIADNGTGGIGLADGANSNLAAPTILMANSTMVSGTVPMDIASELDARVDVYRDAGAQGRYFLGTATINPDFGTWSLSVDLSAYDNGAWKATSTANTLGRGTSAFSAPRTIVVGIADPIYSNGFDMP